MGKEPVIHLGTKGFFLTPAAHDAPLTFDPMPEPGAIVRLDPQKVWILCEGYAAENSDLTAQDDTDRDEVDGYVYGVSLSQEEADAWVAEDPPDPKYDWGRYWIACEAKGKR